jgi:pimeloyl-ACP methyl ester carboxylesterase
VLLAAGCGGIGVRRAEGPTITDAWRVSAVTGDDLSPRTRQTLRQFDLDALYPDRLAELSAKLHGEAVRAPSLDLLFALAEVNYLRGTRAEKKDPHEACVYYYLTAGYAYHFLFDAPPGEAQNGFDPRFRLACDLYNAGLAKCLTAAQHTRQLDPREKLALPAADGKEPITLRVVHKGFRFRPEEFGPLRLCSEFEVVGLDNHHRTFGLGVPLVGSRDPTAPLPKGAFYPPQVTFPVTAFFRFEGGLEELQDHRAGWLELYNPLTTQSLSVSGQPTPLESDLTTPLACYLASANLDSAGYAGFLHPDSLGDRAGLHTLDPYEPGRIPVVLVHGLLGSPVTWAPLFNDLQADPVLRRRFQFWVYFYPTADPYLLTAADLRGELAKMRQTLDPEGVDPALNDMVLVGHSMGGLVSRLLTVDGGDDFWRLISATSLDRLQLQAGTRDELRQTFYFQRQPYVTRAIFLGTPHHGSKLSPSLLGRLGARLAGLPREVMAITRDVLDDNPQAVTSLRAENLTSIDLLAPDAPALQLIAHRPRPPAVHYHSVIGVTGRSDLLLERLFGGGYCQPSDGVVPYSSAHLEDVDSELVVPADHFHVHQHPLAVLEVRRILLEHLRDYDRRQPIQRAVGLADGVR